MRKPLLAIVVSTLLAGCVLGPNYQRPDSALPDGFTHADGAGLGSGAALAQYWDAFDDETLKQLIADALKSNHDLRIASARLGEVRASRRAALADLFPIVTASLKHDRSKRSPQEMPGVPDDQLRSDYYDAGFDASWETSLFGRGVRGVQAQNAYRDAAIARLWGTQVAVTAELARSYFELRGLQARRVVIATNGEGQRAAFDIVTAQSEEGRGNELDRLRGEALLETTLAALPRIDAQITRTIYRISVLSGRTPQALEAQLSQVAALPALPELIPVGSPADLLARRPDILVAERELAAQTALIGYRLNELFPRIYFSGGVGSAAGGIDDLGSSGTGRWQFAPELRWAAFDLPRVLATVKVERAKTEAALARYEQVVLQALEDADGSLRAYDRSALTRAHLERAAAASAEASKLARLRYENGLSDFLSVIDADRSRLAAEDELIQAHTESATNLIAVFKALGGGWAGPAGD